MKNWLSLFANYSDSKQSGGKMFIKMQSKYKLGHNYEKMRELHVYTSIKPNPQHAEWNLSFIVLGYFKC